MTARAQVPNPIDCNDAGNTAEMNECADRAYQKADKALNAAYKQTLEYIRAHGGDEKPYDAASWEKALKDAQRAWIAYRDAECKELVAIEWTGGSGTSAAVTGCMTELTEQRTKMLKGRYASR